MSMRMTQSRGGKAFDVCNTIFLGGVGVLALYPFIYTLSMSLSSQAEAIRPGLHLFPREISLTAYKLVLSDAGIVTGYINAIIRTVIGTALTVLFTCLTAYPLARKETPHRRLFLFIILFTMIFSGGIVPSYLLIKNLGLINTHAALILPHVLAAFNVIVVKNFFQSIPEEMAESARMDGASECTILFRIFIPLSAPVIATISLWTAVAHWNWWLDALIYITDDRRQVLQVILQRIVIDSSTEAIEQGLGGVELTEFTPETIKAAAVVITVAPMLLIYPFVQRYFVKGILLGGVKE